MRKQPKERITVTIDVELLAKVDGLAERRGETRSALVERVVGYAIDEYDEEMQRLESPLNQILVRAITKSPEALRLMARAVGNSMTKDEFREFQGRLESDLDFAAERKRERRAGGGKRSK